ncbi:putative nuclease HARBI1 [Pleurodeles waltl]|uniref:putative nuclease HARBI1 n=1 Tax=Pleurodeles waltl TaxID=8319 RepID=UPI00370963B8
MSISDQAAIAIPALGRPFRLGMLYDCRSDELIPGDSAYAVRTYIPTPYLSPATPAERRYNAAHRATRSVVERSFGLLKSRFRCIHTSGGALQYSPETTCQIVAKCAMMHNIATTKGIPVEPMEPDLDEDGDPLPPHHPVDRSSAAESRQGRADITYNHF